MKYINKRKKQSGVIMATLLGAVILLGVLAYIGSTVYSSIVNGNQRSNLTIISAQALTQAGYMLSVESTRNASGIPVASSFASGGSPAPTNGGIIPATSGAPKLDSWGTNLGYCTKAASAQSDPVFALISAGPNKNFDTTCDQALVGTVVGDDKIVVKSVANILQGVGGTVYYGDPVANLTALGNLGVVAPGQIRIVTSDGSVWLNKTGGSGSGNWGMLVAASNSTSVIAIQNIGDTCYTGTNAQNQAKEGIAITSDRTTLLTCQNNIWSPANASSGSTAGPPSNST